MKTSSLRTTQQFYSNSLPNNTLNPKTIIVRNGYSPTEIGNTLISFSETITSPMTKQPSEYIQNQKVLSVSIDKVFPKAFSWLNISDKFTNHGVGMTVKTL